MTDIAATLAQRGSRYGRFDDHADITQRLKTVIGNGLRVRSKSLEPDQQEALDMICHKIGRIINGDANYDDSWVDIAGYAKLVADRLQGAGEHAPVKTASEKQAVKVVDLERAMRERENEAVKKELLLRKIAATQSGGIVELSHAEARMLNAGMNVGSVSHHPA